MKLKPRWVVEEYTEDGNSEVLTRYWTHRAASKAATYLRLASLMYDDTVRYRVYKDES